MGALLFQVILCIPLVAKRELREGMLLYGESKSVSGKYPTSLQSGGESITFNILLTAQIFHIEFASTAGA